MTMPTVFARKQIVALHAAMKRVVETTEDFKLQQSCMVAADHTHAPTASIASYASSEHRNAGHDER